MKSLPIAIIATVSAALLSGCGSSFFSDETAASSYAAQDLRAKRLELVEALKQNPSDTALRLDYARTLNELGDGVGAQAALEQLPANIADQAEASALLGHALLIQGKPEAAIEAANRAGEQSPLAEWVAVGALLATGQEQDAYDRIAAAGKTHPDNVRLIALDGEMALRRGNISRGSERAAKGLSLDPASLPIRVLAGRIALLQEDYETAEEHFKIASDVRPDAMTPLAALAATQADLNKTEAAEESLARLLSLAPKHPHGILLKAKLAFAGGDIEEAHRLMQSGEQSLRSNPIAQLLGGEIDHLRGNHQSAIVRLSPFLKQNPDHIHASTVLAQAYLATDKPEAAWDVVQGPAQRAAASPQLLAVASRTAKALGKEDSFADRLVTGDPSDEAHEMLKSADRAMAASEWQKAADIYRELRGMGFAGNALVLNNGALAELGMGNTGEALKLARQAIALVPEDPQVKDTLGWVLLKNGGANGEALKLIASAHQARPTDLEIRWHYAVALARNGRKAEARLVASAIRQYARAEQRDLIDDLLAQL